MLKQMLKKKHRGKLNMDNITPKVRIKWAVVIHQEKKIKWTYLKEITSLGGKLVGEIIFT